MIVQTMPGSMPLLLDVIDEARRKIWDSLVFALGFVTTVRNNWLTQIANAINAGAGAGLFRLYDGTRPSTGGTATTLLAEMPCADPVQLSISGGVLTYDTITQDSSANATGTTTWCRQVDSDGNVVYDGNCGTSGADLNLTTTSIVAGQPVQITSATITAPNA